MDNKEAKEQVMKRLDSLLAFYEREYDNCRSGSRGSFSGAKSEYRWMRGYFAEAESIDFNYFPSLATAFDFLLSRIDSASIDSDYPEPTGAKSHVRRALEELKGGDCRQGLTFSVQGLKVQLTDYLVRT